MRPDLAACYGQERLPSYTSYPTAPHFSAAIGPGKYAEWLKAIPQHATASLYLHVPYCRSMCWYCGCNTSVVRRDEPIAVYASALRCEIELVSRQIDRRIKVDHIHFGGGTPTIMAPGTFADLMGSIRQSFFVLPSAEIAIEIDPRTLTRRDDRRARLRRRQPGKPRRAELRSAWFSAPSTGCRVSRRPPLRPKACGGPAYAGLNFDLIYGLPHQTVASCLDTVEPLRRASSRPVFGVRLRPRSDLQEASAQDRRCRRCPTAWSAIDQSEAIAGALKEAGYVQIGLDHFALPDDEMARGVPGGQAAPEFSGLHDRREQYPARLRRQRHRAPAARLCAERSRHPRLRAGHRTATGWRPSRATP